MIFLLWINQIKLTKWEIGVVTQVIFLWGKLYFHTHIKKKIIK